MTSRFHTAIALDEIAEGAARGVIVAGWPILIARVDGALLATIDRCTHAASELATGRIRRGAVMCPLHGARFDLATGRCIGGPYKPLMTFPVRETDGMIAVDVPDDAPGFEHLPIRAKRSPDAV